MKRTIDDLICLFSNSLSQYQELFHSAPNQELESTTNIDRYSLEAREKHPKWTAAANLAVLICILNPVELPVPELAEPNMPHIL